MSKQWDRLITSPTWRPDVPPSHSALAPNRNGRERTMRRNWRKADWASVRRRRFEYRPRRRSKSGYGPSVWLAGQAVLPLHGNAVICGVCAFLRDTEGLQAPLVFNVSGPVGPREDFECANDTGVLKVLHRRVEMPDRERLLTLLR